LQGQLDRERMVALLNTRIWQYAKRQKTWFKKDTRIHWVKSPEEAANFAI
jgi:tRNA A37 N6-isopentenylltransferase MiaA